MRELQDLGGKTKEMISADLMSRYILNSNRNLLITFGLFFGAIVFILALSAFDEETQTFTKQNISFLLWWIFIAVVIVCLYHIYLVYDYRNILLVQNIHGKWEWIFFPLFIIVFCAVPFYFALEEINA